MMRLLTLVAATLAFQTIAYSQNITPIDPGTAFRGASKPDILGLNSDVSPDEARKLIERHFQNAKEGIRDNPTKLRFGPIGVSGPEYTQALALERFAANQAQLALPIQADNFALYFTTPASGNRPTYISRSIVFSGNGQPAKAEYVQQIVTKYGSPTLSGGNAIFYIYQGGNVVSGAAKADASGIVSSLRQPIPMDRVRALGSCLGIASGPVGNTGMTNYLGREANLGNCEGVLAIQIQDGSAADRISFISFRIYDFKRVLEADKIEKQILQKMEEEKRRSTPTGAVPKL